eukprot:4051025-Ditylum_brightwellii.AAC.1
MEAAKKSNFFSVKYGVSKHYSPCMILHHKNIDFKRRCEFVFEEYVMVHLKPGKTNTNQPCALVCIYL